MGEIQSVGGEFKSVIRNSINCPRLKDANYFSNILFRPLIYYASKTGTK